MDEDKRGKSLAFWLVLFFLIVILLGAFVGKRLVQIVRASIGTEETEQVFLNMGEEPDEKQLLSSQVSDQVAPLELDGGYPFPSPTITQLPTQTETPPPTKTETTVPTKTETTIPTNTPTRTVFIVVGGTETPTSTATISPTPTMTRTPSTPPTVGPEGNPGNYIGAGMVLGLIGLACFYLYFWNLTQNRRER